MPNKTILIAVMSIFILAKIACGQNGPEPNYEEFYQSLDAATEDQALKTGQILFERIEARHRADAGFGALKSKMAAADFLGNQMVSQLKKATGKQMFAVADDLFDEKTKKKKKKDTLSVAPAKSFYETSLEIFKKPVNVSQLNAEEKKFLVRYYDLKLRILTEKIAKAGQALAIAEPSFKGTYDYVLVLALLHASEDIPINVDILPAWMRQSVQLMEFSDSCLLHYGLPFHAQAFALKAARLDNKELTAETFYKTASQKCAKKYPHVAVDCLQRAISGMDENRLDDMITLRFDIVQLWLDSDNYSLAAGEAKYIADYYPEHSRCGDAIWLYYYALSRAGSVEAILTNIDGAIKDQRCSGYRPKLMYIKWWALRRHKDQTAQIAALEHNLITEYGNDPMIAPIILSRATDLLARQDYSGALELLDQVQEKFPATAAARQAKMISEKLKQALPGS